MYARSLVVLAGLPLIVSRLYQLAGVRAAGPQAPASRHRHRRRPAELRPPAAMKVGYISLGESIPFVKLVSDNIKAEAEKAGVEIAFCDSEIDAAKALACAQNLKVQGVQAVLNFQLFEDSSPEVCAAYGDLPTIAIDIHQAPCEVAFMGADNTVAGEIVREVRRRHAQGRERLRLRGRRHARHEGRRRDHRGARERHDRRLRGGLRQDPADKFKSLDVGGTTDLAVTKFGDQLSAIKPGGKIVVLSLNDDMSLGAFAAARTAGREAELRLAGQGADPTSWKDIACNPQWLADTAYFPERYGEILIPAVVELLNGETVEKNLFTKHEVVTKDNVRTLYPDTPAC